MVRKSRLCGCLGPSGWFRWRKTVRDIHSAEHFRAILQREQDRARRGQHEFSLVVFDTPTASKTDSARLQSLARALAARIRSVDEAGWLDSRYLGVILPYTPVVGARKLATDVCQACTLTSDAPKWSVYTYPSKWFCDDANPRQYYFKDILPKWGIARPSDARQSANGPSGTAFEFAACCRLAQPTLNGEVLARAPRSFSHRPLPVWKRAMDILGAAGGLILASPFFLIVSVMIKSLSRGPVFFKQQRIGYMGKPFTMWKFRTMKVNADTSNHRQHVTRLINGCGQNGEGFGKPMVKMDDDPQIIPFGKILRKMCLDELPQLINVVRGEMSLVGPRPAIAYEVEAYASWHHRRLDTVPGVTGLWQVNGKNLLTFNEMVRLDIEYLRERSFWLDIGILLKTPFAVFSQFKDSLREKRPTNELAIEKCLASE